ncbi:hypothetical protein NT239_04170 [Chitinibacter sp. SCUT-21]|uniref:hypothetical protein n=1 Tax=Chitinibacter sp. SCUT-21 TaxID=2970891 RepID=UPI0035A6A2DF
MEKILQTRDELAFRIEMALMSGLSRELDKYREQSESMPSFLHALIRDLRAFAKIAPREATGLKERLIQGMHQQDQTGSFKVTMAADEHAHLSSLAVR